MKKKVFITGGEGFIGRRIIEMFGDKYSFISPHRSEGFNLIDPSSFPQVNPDILLHLAGVSRKENYGKMASTNIIGTLNTLEFCRRTNSRMIFISSGAVYGNTSLPVNEKYFPAPNTFYALTKLVAEQICSYYNEKFNIPLLVLRVGNVYGPGQRDFLIPNIIKQFDNEEIVLDNESSKRDYIFLDDVVRGIEAGLRKDFKREIVNIGYGESYSVKEVARIITEKKLVFKNKDISKNDIFLDTSKAKKYLGWNPKVPLEEGIRIVLGSQ